MVRVPRWQLAEALSANAIDIGHASDGFGVFQQAKLTPKPIEVKDAFLNLDIM